MSRDENWSVLILRFPCASNIDPGPICIFGFRVVLRLAAMSDSVAILNVAVIWVLPETEMLCKSKIWGPFGDAPFFI